MSARERKKGRDGPTSQERQEHDQKSAETGNAASQSGKRRTTQLRAIIPRRRTAYQAAAAFLDAVFFTAGFRAAGFLAVTAGLALASASSPAPTVASPLAGGLALRSSNSKLFLPSLPRTRKALNGRFVRCEMNPGSKSVLPSLSSLTIWSGRISCCKMMRLLRKSQALGWATVFSQT